MAWLSRPGELQPERWPVFLNKVGTPSVEVLNLHVSGRIPPAPGALGSLCASQVPSVGRNCSLKVGVPPSDWPQEAEPGQLWTMNGLRERLAR